MRTRKGRGLSRRKRRPRLSIGMNLCTRFVPGWESNSSWSSSSEYRQHPAACRSKSSWRRPARRGLLCVVRRGAAANGSPARSTLQVQDSTAPLVPLACPLLDAELLESTVRAFVQRVAELETEQSPTLLLLDVDRLAVDAQAELEGLLAIEELGLRSLATSRLSLFELGSRNEFRGDLAR